MCGVSRKLGWVAIVAPCFRLLWSPHSSYHKTCATFLLCSWILLFQREGHSDLKLSSRVWMEKNSPVKRFLAEQEQGNRSCLAGAGVGCDSQISKTDPFNTSAWRLISYHTCWCYMVEGLAWFYFSSRSQWKARNYLGKGLSMTERASSWHCETDLHACQHPQSDLWGQEIQVLENSIP